ncbi:hypothetical protein COO60DRAFT_1540537 [Scenedesmus sp. NREL 46B-D3]|nr:hypothetical protein COO60DRAFT_1540537 [Scenedesmus sp. NREL 46B-D3]
MLAAPPVLQITVGKKVCNGLPACITPGSRTSLIFWPIPTTSPRSMASLNVFALVLLACAVGYTAGQGLGLAKASTVGASSTLSQLQQLYSGSQAWKRAYKQNPKSACSIGIRGSLCAAASTEEANTYAQLMMATSPPAYRSSSTGSAVQLVAASQDQQQCHTCAAFAVAAAAETAMASILQVDVRQCSISVQALYSCPPGRPTRSCSAGWNLPDALEQLQLRGSSLPTTACLPYKPDFRRQLTTSQLCTGNCSMPNEHASKGQFSSMQITNIWEAQQHIRQYGAVVSRFDVMSDFIPFFADKQNAKAVYRPSASAQFDFGHAIALVGYNNQQRYWLAKNSYGTSWGDGGLFRVAYGACSVLTPRTGEAYGIIWTPISSVTAMKLPLQKGPKPDCFLYKARPGDFISGVAWQAGVPLERFMLDNIATVKDLDAPLQGTQLLLCNPQQGTSSIADPQLEALLSIQQAIDTTGVLHRWNKASGAAGGYCRWEGVTCMASTTNVIGIRIYSGVGIQGLKGVLPAGTIVGRLDKLIEFTISHQPGVTGTLPADWSLLTSLEYVQMLSNALTGGIPSSWGNLTRLKVLDLSRNTLTSTLPASLGNMRSLMMLALQKNRFTGSIPASLGSLKMLNALGLGNNQFSGSLPDTLKGLSAIEMLYVERNTLSGTLPPWLGSLKSLVECNFENNRFGGTIPASISSLSRLKLLGLGGNRLTGTLPDALGQLTGLQQLSITGNNLAGSVPASWSSMKSLSSVFMNHNPLLGGCLPSAWYQQMAGRHYMQNVMRGTNITGFC